jgi:hypothetical protein
MVYIALTRELAEKPLRNPQAQYAPRTAMTWPPRFSSTRDRGRGQVAISAPREVRKCCIEFPRSVTRVETVRSIKSSVEQSTPNHMVDSSPVSHDQAGSDTSAQTCRLIHSTNCSGRIPRHTVRIILRIRKMQIRTNRRDAGRTLELVTLAVPKNS